MIDAQSFIGHVEDAGARIARDAEGNLDTTVPSCPEMSVAQLLAHTAAFCRWSGTIVRTGQSPTGDLGDVADPVEAHREHHAALVEALTQAEPDDEAWTWSVGDKHKRFWYRRAAQELAVHSWDVSNAAGKALPIDPTLAADGIDEMLRVFGAPNDQGFPTVAQVLDNAGHPIRIETTDTQDVWTFATAGEVFDFDATDPDVTIRGTASDLLLYVWGRLGKDALDIEGDSSLVDRWTERVRI